MFVQKLNNMQYKQNNQDHFNVLRKIRSNPNYSQRKLAEELGFALEN